MDTVRQPSAASVLEANALPSPLSPELNSPAPAFLRRLPLCRSIPLAWHLLSLDAPTVAALWCFFLSRTLHIPVPWAEIGFLSLGTWWIYVADRLLDGRMLDRRISAGRGLGSSGSTDSPLHRRPRHTALRNRHLFYARYRLRFLTLLITTAALFPAVAWKLIPAFIIRRDLSLCAIGLGYFVIVHSRPSQPFLEYLTHLFPKELAVGICFGVATVLPLVRGPYLHALPYTHPEILVSALVFALLCWLNCAAIQNWEDCEQPRHRISCFAALLALATSLPMAAPRILHPPVAPFPILAAVSLSSTGFFILSFYSGSLPRQTLRIAADALLLTPIILLG